MSTNFLKIVQQIYHNLFVLDILLLLDHMLDHHHEYRVDRIARYVEENFSHEVVGERLNAVYHSLLAERG